MNKKRLSIIFMMMGAIVLLLLAIAWRPWEKPRPASPVEAELRKNISYTLPANFTKLSAESFDRMPLDTYPLDNGQSHSLTCTTDDGSETLVLLWSSAQWVREYYTLDMLSQRCAGTLKTQHVAILSDFKDIPPVFDTTTINGEPCVAFTVASSNGLLLGLPLPDAYPENAILYHFVEIAAFGKNRQANVAAVRASFKFAPVSRYKGSAGWWYRKVRDTVFAPMVDGLLNLL